MSHAHSTRRIDLLGQKFGSWTVVAFDGICPSQKGARWLCRCACGRQRVIPGSRLRNGKSTGCQSCSVQRGKAFRDLTGMRFGQWTVLRCSHKRAGRHRCWLCRCDCGREDVVSGNSLAAFRTGGCRACKAKRMERVARSAYWSNILFGAQYRGLAVTVSVDEAFAILEQQGFACALTGEPIGLADSVKGHKSGESTASLDRIDSSKGYVSGNLQWLHKDVNCMKMDLSQERFIRVCIAVAARHKRE